MATLLAALIAFGGLIAKWATEDSAPSPTATTPSRAKPASGPAAGEPEALEPTHEPAAPFAADDIGFINSNARCEGTQPALAIGRTEKSLVVICADQAGHFEYLGVRLRDDAVLRAAAQTTPARGFLAYNASVVYAVSPTELLVTAGDTVIKKEAMIEYREQRFVPAEAAHR